MPKDERQKDVEWRVVDEAGFVIGTPAAQLAVLMDLRDELKEANQHLAAMQEALDWITKDRQQVVGRA